MTPSESHALLRRELAEQADILTAAAEPLAAQADRLRPPREGALWIGGCGDSLFAAQALSRFLRGAGWDMRPASAAEMLWDARIATGDTVVGLSISGSTRRTVEAIARGRELGARTLAITINPDSALARAADATLILPFQPISRAIPHGLDYHMTLLAIASLAGVAPAAAVAHLLRTEVGARLERARLAAEGARAGTRFVFLGSGPAAGSAAYAAAKLHEAGGLAAWSFEAENFCHGANFMLRPEDRVVLMGGGGPGDRRTRALRPGLERLVASVEEVALGLDPGDPQASLLAAHACALHAQALCLALAERLGLDVTDPAAGSGAAEVQREWFGWTSG